MKLKLIILLSLALAACKNPNEKKNAIIGQWQGTDWLLDGKPSGMDASQVHFNFKDDGTYSANFGEQKQSGTWRFENEKLYTTLTGRPELEITVLKADGTVLEFEMGLRSGSKEGLKFKRE